MIRHYAHCATVALIGAALTWTMLTGFDGLAASWTECHRLAPCPADAMAILAEAR